MSKSHLFSLLLVLLFVSLVIGAEKTPTVFEENVAKFERWYKDRNPITDKLFLKPRSPASHILGNASVYLTIQSIGEGDHIFEAPEELAITLKTVEDSPVGHLLQGGDQLRSLSPINKLALYFLYYKKCVSSTEGFFWKSYFKILPEADQLNHPLLMTESEVNRLKGSVAFDWSVSIRDEAKSTFQLLKTHLFDDEDVEALTECPDITFDDWKWALATVLARSQWYVDLKEAEDDHDHQHADHQHADHPTTSFPAIIPYFDFIGHYPSAKSLNGRTKEGIYHAELEFQEEGEVLRSIQPGCNSYLFANTGLFLENSPWPCATLPPSFMDRAPAATSPELEAKRQLGFKKLAENGMGDMTFHIYETTITEELLLRSEMLTMSLNDYEAIDNLDESKVEELAEATRIRALRWLASEIKLYVKESYPTTIEQDKALMESREWANLSRREQVAVMVVYEEKSVLSRFVDELESQLSAVGAEEKDEL